MAIDKDFINELRAEIAAYILEESDIFPTDSVYAFPKSTLSAYPAVVIMPSENISDYGDTEVNKLNLAFNLIVYYPMQTEGDQEDAELAVGEAVGELLRIFSGRNELTGCDWVQPAPSVWADVTVGEANFRTAMITLRCIKYVDVR